MKSEQSEILDLDLKFPDFVEAPLRAARPFCYLSWLEEIEPFRQYFESRYGASVPRTGGCDTPFVL
jgi:hypothetical protein